MEFQYCTYFDSNYFLRGLALFHSLRQYQPHAVLWVLCLDDATFANITRLAYPGLKGIHQRELEAEDPELFALKPQRTKVEYYWSSGPSWLLYVLRNNPDAPGVIYLDGDLFLFAPLTPIYQELENASILIHEHRFTNDSESLSATQGRFNVGVVAFRRDSSGMACLKWWRERCIEWCFMRNEPGLFGDQKYLDQFPILFQNVHVLSHVGVGVASWNVGSHRIHFRNDTAMVDELPLVIYHFQGIHVLNPSVILNFGTRRITPGLRRIFSLYTRAIYAVWLDCRRKGIFVQKNQLDAKWNLTIFSIFKAVAAGRLVLKSPPLTALIAFPGTLLKKILGK